MRREQETPSLQQSHKEGQPPPHFMVAPFCIISEHTFLFNVVLSNEIRNEIRMKVRAAGERVASRHRKRMHQSIHPYLSRATDGGAVVRWTTLAKQGAPTEPRGENRSRGAGSGNPEARKNTSDRMCFLRATDGARTRGLDLGKVARYQLRHCRICNVYGSHHR